MAHRLLVPVDFSRYTEAVLQRAAVAATLHEASVDVLHVWRPPFHVPEPWASATVEVAPESNRQVVTRCEHALRGAVEKLKSLGVQDVQTRLVEGLTSKTILDLVRSETYDLVVMGNHGQTGLEHAYLGSVTERVLRRCPIPVLVVPTPEPADAEDV